MKKIILPLLLFTTQFAIGQLSNLNLESWITTSNGPEPSLWTYDDGTGTQVYGTYNIYTPLTTSKITGAQAAGGTGSSAKLQTILDVPGLLYQYKPFSGTMPQSVSFSFKNQTAVNDTSFVLVNIYDGSGNVLKEAYLELYSADNNSNWHIQGIPFVNLASGTPAFIDFLAQSSYSSYPTISGSVIYIDNITLNNCSTPIVSSFSETTCQPYEWNGQIYSTSGNYSQTFVSQNGCDSTVTLNLSVINPGALTAVPDPVFEQKLIDLGYDPCGILDGTVPTLNIQNVTSFIYNVSPSSTVNKITDLTGIEDFTNLETLRISGHDFQSNGINLSNNINLKDFTCQYCGLQSLDVSNNINLESLDVSNNIDASSSYWNNLSELNVSSNNSLELLFCDYNNISSLNLFNNSSLITLRANHNLISSLTFPNFVSGISTNCQIYADWNNLNSLNNDSNTFVEKLSVNHNYFSGLNVSSIQSLRSLYCSDNFLECLSVKNGFNNLFVGFDCLSNFNLMCIEVDDSTYSTNNPIWNAGIDSWSSFNNDCLGICLTADAEEQNISKTFIYPNPTYESLSINVDNSVIGKTFSIVDLSGKTLLNGKIESTLVKVDVRKLTSGIYFVQIANENSTLKFIIE